MYQPTPNPEFPSVITPAFAGWAHVTPFVLRHGLQFGVEPGDLFNLAGAQYAAQYNEVKTVGSARVRGALPDSEESDIARFWPGGGSNWNATARTVVSGKGLDRWQHAQLFALLAKAQADALIANQTWKYSYNFWRPVTAIRWSDDGNPDTGSEAVWRPFLVTPPYPDYPCGADCHGSGGRGPEAVARHRPYSFHTYVHGARRAVAGADDAAARQVDHENVRHAVGRGREVDRCTGVCRHSLPRRV